MKASVGHIRDLPSRAPKGIKQLVPGVDLEHDFAPTYEVDSAKKKTVTELRKLAKGARDIWFATDLDREGEAIAWHLAEELKVDPKQAKRVTFDAITKSDVQRAFENPRGINMPRVEAQQARRIVDRIVGYRVSPILWKKVASGLSAGRVQSVAVRLIVEREREIRAFVPEEYWDAFADLGRQNDTAPVRFQVSKYQGETFRPPNDASAMELLGLLKSQPFEIAKREDKPTRSRPNAPFITSTLQQSASTRMGFSVKKTMTMAQRLYEAGYITYMRTDSTNLSTEAVEAARALIGNEYGADYLPETPKRYSSKEDAQEAHEAIRPSNVSTTPDHLTGVDGDAVRLYGLIRNQFLACQMTDARYLSTSIKARAGEFELSVRGRILQFDGFTRVLPPMSKKDEDATLPDFQAGDPLMLADCEAIQHFTKPTPRFGEASLVKELEKLGIGRPSTYASIISTIQDRA